jgi:hypothetical protein
MTVTFIMSYCFILLWHYDVSVEKFELSSCWFVSSTSCPCHIFMMQKLNYLQEKIVYVYNTTTHSPNETNSLGKIIMRTLTPDIIRADMNMSYIYVPWDLVGWTEFLGEYCTHWHSHQRRLTLHWSCYASYLIRDYRSGAIPTLMLKRILQDEPNAPLVSISWRFMVRTQTATRRQVNASVTAQSLHCSKQVGNPKHVRVWLVFEGYWIWISDPILSFHTSLPEPVPVNTSPPEPFRVTHVQSHRRRTPII